MRTKFHSRKFKHLELIYSQPKSVNYTFQTGTQDLSKSGVDNSDGFVFLSVKRDVDNQDGFISMASKRIQYNGIVNNYNKEDKTIEQRNQSNTLHLRKLDNWVKKHLIQEYCKNCKRVLDLACGKGGDLKKWREQNIKDYVGIDIADRSISDAVVRFKSMKNPEFCSRFIVANIGSISLSDVLEQVLFFYTLLSRVRCLILSVVSLLFTICSSLK